MTNADLNRELADAGASTDYIHLGTLLSPLDALVNGSFSSKPYLNILIKYLAIDDSNTKEFIARALTEKGNREASRPLLKLFSDPSMSEDNLWAVGNALYVIDDKNTYPEIVELCRKRSLGSSRQMLLGTLARAKSEEAYQVLIDCLDDAAVRGHAIEALGRFGNPRAIEVLENLEVKKGLYEYKAKQTALKRLHK